MSQKSSKMLYVFLLGLLVVGGVYIVVDKLIITDAEQQAIYEKAKAHCTSEIWPVYEDIGAVYAPQPLTPPFPDSYKQATQGSTAYGFFCTKEEAIDYTNWH